MPADKLDWIAEALSQREQAGLRRGRRTNPAAAKVNFGSNDYLGLAADPRLAEAAHSAAARHGWGSGASPSVCGRSAAQEELEQRIATFENVEDALVFPSGYAANAGVIPALVDEGDAIYADAKNHASLIDGCRLSRAERFVYPHADHEELGRLLSGGSHFHRRLIVTDTLFSMDGDFAPLAEIAQLAEQFDAMVLVDEAHATGVWGPTGRGAVEQLAADAPKFVANVSIRIGTLSKAFGCSGGFVTGSQQLIEWLFNKARPYVFSTAAPPACAAAASAAIDIAQQEPERRNHVIQLSEKLRRELKRDGWDLGASASQIIPILLGEPELAVRYAASLAERGLFVPAIRPPSVPEGESLLRVSITARHSEAELDQLLEGLRALRSS